MARPRLGMRASVFDRYVDPETKICPTCQTPQHVSKYGADRKVVDKLWYECNPCRAARQKHKYQTRPEFREAQAFRTMQHLWKNANM